MLDSNAYHKPAQLRWLDRDLADARRRGVRAIFAAVHDGPYSRGSHRGNRFAAKRYAPVMARHGVSMVFSGHDHLYQRGKVNGLRYMVSGGGGAPLYKVSCGVPGRRPCRTDDGMITVESVHHYAIITVYQRSMQVCAKRADGSTIECVKLPTLRRRLRRAAH